MAIAYNWVIRNMVVAPMGNASNVVTHVHFAYEATDGTGNKAACSHVAVLDAPDANNFIEYGNLTEAQVTAWVQEWLTPAVQAEWEAKMAQELAAKYPQQDLPWAVPPAPPVNDAPVPIPPTQNVA